MTSLICISLSSYIYTHLTFRSHSAIQLATPSARITNVGLGTYHALARCPWNSSLDKIFLSLFIKAPMCESYHKSTFSCQSSAGWKSCVRLTHPSTSTSFFLSQTFWLFIPHHHLWVALEGIGVESIARHTQTVNNAYVCPHETHRRKCQRSTTWEWEQSVPA